MSYNQNVFDKTSSKEDFYLKKDGLKDGCSKNEWIKDNYLNIENIYIEECKTGWDDIINKFTGHPLQLDNWGSLKSQSLWTGKKLLVKISDDKILAAASVLTRKLPFGFGKISHIPRGPAFAEDILKNIIVCNLVFDKILQWIKKNIKPIALICEPAYLSKDFKFLTRSDSLADLEADNKIINQIKNSFVQKMFLSTSPILFNKTLIINLKQSEDQMLANLSRKNRSHLRSAERKGIKIKIAQTKDDIKDVLKIYKEVANRASFSLHKDEYFYKAFELDIGPLYIAYLNTDSNRQQPLAFLWLATSKFQAFELWGGANSQGQISYANNLIKWFAICDMKKNRKIIYDMNGLLNQGISNFKKSFEKREDILTPSYTISFSLRYKLYIFVYRIYKFLKKYV
ncbi:MAG: aminoacyltransferase [Bifidobacteriaceae bacterium]|jgi:lipid II:glycine glycyltransferase (peptidoglycan interpeptide bridge formation enzyme)|nr:aminoacyltransferase [Bifidobacteriaceae bacterium]